MHKSWKEIKNLDFIHIRTLNKVKHKRGQNLIHSLYVIHRVNLNIKCEHLLHQSLLFFIFKFGSFWVKIDDILVRKIKLNSCDAVWVCDEPNCLFFSCVIGVIGECSRDQRCKLIMSRKYAIKLTTYLIVWIHAFFFC